MIAVPEAPIDNLAMAIRVGASLLAGAAIGINRDLHHKSAGLRTHALVAVGSASAVILALVASPNSGDGATRVMQGLITGIGFLGAGVILHRESKRRIEGLTTAASIWVSAVFGMACGGGLFALAAMAVGAALFVLAFGGPIEKALERRFLKKANVDPSLPAADDAELVTPPTAQP